MNITFHPVPEAEARRLKAAALRAARADLAEARRRATVAEDDLIAIRGLGPPEFEIHVTP